MHNESMRKPPSITRSKKEALELINELASKVKPDGSNFADLARESSDCPSKKRGGDLGRFGRGMMAPSFEKASQTIWPTRKTNAGSA